jgi:hypothetical protein
MKAAMGNERDRMRAPDAVVGEFEEPQKQDDERGGDQEGEQQA